MAYSYNELLGRSAPTAAASPPQMSVTGQGPNNPGPDGAAGMLTSHSPSVWFLILLFAAAGLARAGHIIR